MLCRISIDRKADIRGTLHVTYPDGSAIVTQLR